MSIIILSGQRFSFGMTSGMTAGRAGVWSTIKAKMSPNFFQPAVGNPELAQMLDRVLNIITAAAKLALALIDQAEELLCGKLTRILGMGAVDDIGERFDRFLGTHHRNTFDNFEINMGELFTLAEIRERFLPPATRNFKNNTPARTTAIQSKDEAWRNWCATVLMRVDAETAVESVKRARLLAQELETRPPHERAVAEHPAIPATHHDVTLSSEPGRNPAPRYPARPPQCRAELPLPA